MRNAMRVRHSESLVLNNARVNWDNSHGRGVYPKISVEFEADAIKAPLRLFDSLYLRPHRFHTSKIYDE